MRDTKQKRHHAIKRFATHLQRNRQDDEPASVRKASSHFSQCQRVSDIFRWEGGDGCVERRVCEGQSLCEGAGESRFAICVAFGEESHRLGFVDRNRIQTSAEKESLQVSRSVTDLENTSPCDEGENT